MGDVAVPASPENTAGDESGEENPDWMRRFFAKWHYPYGAVLPDAVRKRIQDDIAAMPSDRNDKDINSWELLGPSGLVSPEGGIYSGRVLDLDTTTDYGPLVAAASGGLWRYFFGVPVCISNDIPSQWIGSVAVDPDDPNTILIGTGEPLIHGGEGLWKSTDRGSTWHKVTMYPWHPPAFFRVRYGPTGVIHAATQAGYYRSTDGGETWFQIAVGSLQSSMITDIAFDPLHPGAIYITVWDEGVFVSLDDGLHWGKATNGDIPTSDVSRGSITICAADPGVAYAAFAHRDSSDLHPAKGIYKTTNYGQNWVALPFPTDYMGMQGWYNNVIAVSPTDPDLVLAGGTALLRSTDGGQTWYAVSDPQLHGDYHALVWDPDGVRVWAGNDGGWAVSSYTGNSGTWDSSANDLPITQFTEFDVTGTHLDQTGIGGGSQDNGVCVSYDNGATWDFLLGADGGGFEFGSFDQEIFTANGAYGNGSLFHHFYSADGGHTLVEIEDGLPENDMFYPRVEIDGAFNIHTNIPSAIYHWDRWLHQWVNEGFLVMMPRIRDFTVSPVYGDLLAYCCLDSDESGRRLYVRDDSYWYPRDDGLPPGRRVRRVAPHPSIRERAYALIDGLGTPGEKIFRTDDAGITWVNVTGTMIDLPLSDLVVDPDNDDHLYLGTEYGCFRSLDGGAHWLRWTNGMPEGVVISELQTQLVDSEGLHILAATYGRSIWRRRAAGDDPVPVPGESPKSALAILDATPNPFNPRVTIRFATAGDGPVRAEVYDLRGQLVRRLDAHPVSGGEGSVTWDGLDRGGRPAPSGAYIVKLSDGMRTVTRKVVMAR